jgi:CRP-like cAMP-binding protein/ATP/ADP translocase
LLDRVANLFQISRVRARSFIRAAVFFFLFVAGVTALKSATNALYLVRRDPTDLPYLYLATALAITAITMYIGRYLGTFGSKPILHLVLAASAVILAALSILAAMDVRASLGVLYVAGEAYATAISVLYWARLGEIFDVRTAKRVFGAISAAGMAGAVLGGVLVRSLAHVVPSSGWCFLSVLTIAVMYPLLGRDRGKTIVPVQKISFQSGIVYAIVDRFPRGVAFLVLLTSVQTAAVDYVFRTGAVELFSGSNEAALAGMFGVLNAVVGVAAIAVQGVLTPALLRHLGVFAFLSIVPILCIVAAAWSALVPRMFAPLFLLKTIEMMGSLSLYQPGLQLLYNPMPHQVRDSVRALVDGAVKKLGGAAGGALLLFIGGLLGERELLGVEILLALGLLVWIRALKPAYLSALEAKLGARGGLPYPVIDPSDRATRDQLFVAMSSDDPGKVLAAVSVLELDGRIDFRPHIEQLISHSDEGVRLKAIELIMRAPDRAYAPLLVSIIQRDARRPKAQAARALHLVDATEARRVLEPIAAADPGTHDVGLVCAALLALLTGERSPTAERCLDDLLAKGRSASPAERRELARLLGLLGSGPWARQLATFLDDPEPSVRAIAVKAAALARDPMLPPKLIPRLYDRAIQRAVRDALSGYGDEALPILSETLDDRRLPLQLRVHVPRILRQIGTEKAAAAMLFSNVQDDAFLRYVIIEELSRMRRTHADLAFDRARTEEAALRRLRAYTHYRPISADLAGAQPGFNLLNRAIEDRLRQNLEAALRLLGLIYDMAAMEHAIRGFTLGDHTSRADAIELIDVTLQGSEMRAQVIAHLEVGSSSSVSPAASKDPARAIELRVIERATQLVESRDMQIALIAHETLKRIGQEPPDVREPSLGEPLMPKSIVDRVFLLQGVQLFHGLSVDDLAAVAALTKEGHTDPGQVIYREGDPGDSMSVITSGDLHLLRGSQRLMHLGVGDSFGETSILDRGPRPVTACAGDEGVDYLVLERGPFMDLLADRPQVVNGLFVVIGTRLRQLLDLTGTEHGARATDDVASPVAQERARQT